MARQKHRRYRFPWRGKNHFQLLVDDVAFYPTMLDAIHQAQNYVALEMYLVESGHSLDQFLNALLAAAERGVNILLLFDDFGARGFKPADRIKLDHPQIQLHFYNPLQYGELRRSLFRDHRKLLLVDDEVAFVGGAGISDLFSSQQNPDHHWHDIMLSIRGPCLKDWRQLFSENWPGESNLIPETSHHNTHSNEQDQLGRVTVSQMANHREIQRSLVKRLKAAEHWIWVSTAYFVPSWKIRRALKAAKRRGVDVRLILPGPETDHPAVRHAGRRFYYSLLRQGVRIFEYQPRFNHCKTYLCDHWSSLGSSNLDRWNLHWNLEANQEIEDQQFAQQLKAVLQDDLNQCREIDQQRWRQRPWQRRLLEWFWGRIELWLTRMSERLKRE